LDDSLKEPASNFCSQSGEGSGEPAPRHCHGTGADVFAELAPKGLLSLKFSQLAHPHPSCCTSNLRHS